MQKKALCVGINDYPLDQNDLRGCVNDARAWAKLLVDHYEFEKENVKLMLDSEATKANIMAYLADMVGSAVDGDIIVFTNSSHGTYLYDLTHDEPDEYDEAICPYDLNDNLILDDDLSELFKNLSGGINLTVISDSCHSGSVTKALVDNAPNKRRLRFIHPDLIGNKTNPDIRKAKPKSRMVNIDKDMDEILLSACKSTQYANEAEIEGEIRGAMTHFAIKIIEEAHYEITLKELEERLQIKLKDEQFEQDPQLEGKEGLMNKLLFSNNYREDAISNDEINQYPHSNAMDEKQDLINREAFHRYLRLENSRKNARELTTFEKAGKMTARRSVINAYDGMAIERIIMGNDLFPIAYLQLGLNAGKSVARISIRDRIGRVIGYGTGFLVSPSLLLTNNHVLNNKDLAFNSIAEFNLEDDEHFNPKQVVSFRFDTDKLFITDEELDFTLVALKESSIDGSGITDFGFLPLLSQEGKILEGEYVSIIQHPEGGPKAITVRENEVKFLSPNFLHYVTDTQPGSSGSPVFNDQWIVVALHHAGVPDPDDNTKWIANEGIRISSIVAYLETKRSSMDVGTRDLVDQMLSKPLITPSEWGTIEAAVLEKEWYKNSTGYDETFLGKGFEIPLPSLSEGMVNDIAEMEDGRKILPYTHFSIMMSKSRRLAYYTAVNIDGKNRVDVKRKKDKWYFDSRIDEAFQCGPNLYNNNPLDRGHLTRRQDPNWGLDASKANEDTFHFTNCSPQHSQLNQKTWLNLEDYILDNARINELKINVFTGPVFRADDMMYRGEFKIPAEFWKVVVMVKDDNTLSATAYLQTQKNLIQNLEFAYGAYKTYQVTVAQIEALTNLDFGKLKEHDPLATIETLGAYEIESPTDIRL